MLNILQERNIIIKDRESAKELLSDISFINQLKLYCYEKTNFTFGNIKFSNM